MVYWLCLYGFLVMYVCMHVCRYKCMHVCTSDRRYDAVGAAFVAAVDHVDPGGHAALTLLL